MRLRVGEAAPEFDFIPTDVSRCFRCALWRGGHATVEQVGAYSFSSVELRGFAVSEGDRTRRAVGEASVGWRERGRGVGARRDTLQHPTQRMRSAIPVRATRPT